MPDWGTLALGLDRAQFVDRFPHPFLWGTSGYQRVQRPMKTEKFNSPERTGLSRLDGPIEDPSKPTGPLVLAVVKTQSAFASMITVGRTANNDVVIPDTQISRFHAFFKPAYDGLTLEDAGS